MILLFVFMNNGNYGMFVVLLVFGIVGLDMVVVLMVLQQLIMSMIGMYYVVKGGLEVGGFKMVMVWVICMLVVYGVFLGVIFQFMCILIFKEVMMGVELVGNVVILMIMIIFGMQFVLIFFKYIEYRKIFYLLFLKLMVFLVIVFGFMFILLMDDMIK